MYLYEKLALQKQQEKKFHRDVYNNHIGETIVTEDNKRYVSLMSSISHTYGNALAYIQNWIIDLFPENLFKTIHVNSKIAHRQIRSTTHEMLKKTKPMIIFRPRIPNMDEDRFLKNTMLIERQTDIYSTYGWGAYEPFFDDPDNDISIKFQMNRSVLYVDVVAVFATLSQQLDYYHYLSNAVRINHPFNLETCFEAFLPEDMIGIISQCCGVPVYDDNGSTSEFIRYMNGHSGYPITYKLQGSSGRKEFYRYYPVIIDTTISDLDKDEGDRVGQVMNQYQISFTVRMEFMSTGFYYLYSNKIYNIKLPEIHPEETDIIPIFTDVLLKEDLNLDIGWSLYNRASLQLEKDDDTVCIDSLFNSSIREAIKYHLKNGLPMFNFIDIKVRRQGKRLYSGRDYEIDWNTKSITFKNGNVYYTYAILVCINVEYINNLMKDLYNLDSLNP
jgi:hypothetical protein